MRQRAACKGVVFVLMMNERRLRIEKCKASPGASRLKQNANSFEHAPTITEFIAIVAVLADTSATSR